MDDDEEEAAVEPAAELAGDDWLASFGGVDDDEEEAAVEPAAELAGDDDDWLASFGGMDDDEEEAAVEPAAELAGDDWLSGIGTPAPKSADDWLMDVGEEAFEPTDEPPAADWLADIGADAVSAEQTTAQSGGDDWLSGFDLDEDAEPTAEGLSAGAAPLPTADWLSGFTLDEISEDSEALAETDVSAWLGEPDAADLPAITSEDIMGTSSGDDWFSSLESDREAEQEAGSLAGADWLADISDTDEDAFTAAAAEEEPQQEDWLSQFGESTPAATGTTDWLAALDTDEDEQEEAQFETADWLTGEEDELAPAVSADESWLDQFRPTETDIAVTLLEEEPADEQYDWLSELDGEPSARQPEPAAKAAHFALDLVAEDTGEESADYAEELELTAASNAPDWLNAMVPGLDVDYAAEEDRPLEQAYIEAPLHRPRTVDYASAASEFNWLQQIVDEESRPAESERPAPPSTLPMPVAAPATARRRFSFSRPPAWLRRTETPAATPAASATAMFDDDLPAWLDDADVMNDNFDDLNDADLPDWLK